MRVLVCGGREFEDRDAVYGALDALAKEHSFLTVINGGARGADRLARDWVEMRRPSSFDCQIDVVTFEAEWNRHGNAAGPLRNARMLEHGRPDIVLAFPSPTRGLEGTGTGDMVERARAAGVRVTIWRIGGGK